MLRGLFMAATGMLTQQKRMDVVTNNLANATTTGFKEDGLVVRSFGDLLISRMDGFGQRPVEPVGPLGTGIHADRVRTVLTDGPLEETGRQTDIALTGQVFFAIETPEGERYTRAGNFQISEDGMLVTHEGHPVMGQNGPLRVGHAGFTVRPDGSVTSSAGEDRLRLVELSDDDGLRKEGGNRYAHDSARLIAQTETSVRQGFLEGSNVDLSRQMTDMIEIYRSHEINQRMIRLFDEKLGKAVNEIGRL